MPNFSELFWNVFPKRIEYKDQTVILSDQFPVQNGDILILNVESVNSDCQQGFYIDVTGWVKFVSTGKIFKKGKGVKVQFWEGTPKNYQIQVFTKQNFVRVANIWEVPNHTGGLSVHDGHYGAAMIVEEIDNGRRYYCNDRIPDEDFDDIIFTIQKLVSP